MVMRTKEVTHDYEKSKIKQGILARRLAMVGSGTALAHEANGAERKDDRRIISGIIHVLQSGCRWQDCPPAYGPSMTVYNRYHRWAERGIWERIFRDLTSIVGTHYENSIDTTIIKAHRSASEKKGAAAKPSAGVGADGQRKSMPQPMRKVARSPFF